MKQKVCPFCDEDGFDLLGLKLHLMRGYCDMYNNTGHNYLKTYERMKSIRDERKKELNTGGTKTK